MRETFEIEFVNMQHSKIISGTFVYIVNCINNALLQILNIDLSLNKSPRMNKVQKKKM